MRARLLAEENRKWWTLASVSFALFMIMLDNTVVNVALPAIQQDLGIDVAELEWVVTGYALSFAVLMLTGGKLADMHGRRRIFLIGLAVFTFSSLLCGLAGTAELLIGGPCPPGCRGRLHDARDPLDHHRHLPAEGARRRARDLGRCLRDGARDRPARRRPDHRAHRLELDLLPQRARRPRRPRRGPADHPRVEGHLARAAARPPGPRHLGHRAVRARLRADRGEQQGLDARR